MVSLDRRFHALADPTRRAVLERLGGGEATVGELARPFPLSLPAFLKHLRVLEDAGLIETEKRGRTRICRLRNGAYAPLAAWLDDQRRLWEGRTDRLAELAIAMEESADAKHDQDRRE